MNYWFLMEHWLLYFKEKMICQSIYSWNFIHLLKNKKRVVVDRKRKQILISSIIINHCNRSPSIHHVNVFRLKRPKFRFFLFHFFQRVNVSVMPINVIRHSMRFRDTSYFYSMLLGSLQLLVVISQSEIMQIILL